MADTYSLQKPTSDELLKSIFEFMSRLFNEKELSQILAILNDLGKTLAFSDRCSFWYWDKRHNQLWTLAAHDVSKITIPDDTGLVGYAIKNNETLIIPDAYADPRFNRSVDISTGYKTNSILVMPVTDNKSQVIGAYQAINRLYDEPFSDDDVRRLSLAAIMLGKILESHMLYNAALEDQLTGLKNRRGFFDFYETKLLPIITQTTNSVIICDIDFFKKFNDTYGHNAGDAVLRHVSDIFRTNSRIDDGVFRWGGEEFIFLLPRTDLQKAADFADRIRMNIEESVCCFEDLKLKVTMSFGVHQLDPTLVIDENVKAADQKLYVAKENGRNRIEF